METIIPDLLFIGDWGNRVDTLFREKKIPLNFKDCNNVEK